MKLEVPEELLSKLTAGPFSPPGAEWLQARARLRARGHDITTAAAATWLLSCRREHFVPSRFAAAQHGEFGTHLEVWECLDSTNRRAWEAQAEGAPAGSVFLAEEQLAGRGRQGRKWSCAAHAGLLFSLLVPAALSGSPRPQLLPLALAMGVCAALRRSGYDARLKWPNDLVVGARKLGGVLVEARAGAPAHVVVGCGLNVTGDAADFERLGVPGAVSLQQLGPLPTPREELLALLLASMQERCDAWRAERWQALLQEWDGLDVLRGRDVVVHAAAGALHGRALGLTPAGLLRLQEGDGSVRELAAGEVHLT